MTSRKQTSACPVGAGPGFFAGILLAALVFGTCGWASARADDPPKKKVVTPTTKPAAKAAKPTAKKPSSKKPSPKKPAKGGVESDESLGDAKKAALESIGKLEELERLANLEDEGGKAGAGKDAGVQSKSGARRAGTAMEESAAKNRSRRSPGAKTEPRGSRKPGSPADRKATPKRAISRDKPGDKAGKGSRVGKVFPPNADPSLAPGGRKVTRSQPRSRESIVIGDQPEARTKGGKAAGRSIGAGQSGGGASAPIFNTTTTMNFIVESPDPESQSYRFDYDKTLWADVLADFSRISGLSFLNEPDKPIPGEVSFRSPRDYTYQEALHQLNELLLAPQLDKYLIRRTDNYLEVRRLVDWMRDITPEMMFGSCDEMEAAALDDFDIVLVQVGVPENWSPYEIIDQFRHMFSDTYDTQVKGDKIELIGLVREHRRWTSVIEKLTDFEKEPPDDDPRVTVTIRLKSAKVSDVQTMLRQRFPGIPMRPKRGSGPGVDHKAETAKRITILSDIKNNTLWIIAPSSKIAEIVEMVEKLDGDPVEPPHMKIVHLEHADAVALVNQLKPIFAKQLADITKKGGRSFVPEHVRRALDRDILADGLTNSVIIIGSVEGVAGAEKMVRQKDVPDTGQVNEIIELQHADAEDVVAALSATMSSAPRRGGRKAKGAPIPGMRQITVRSSKSLLVSCRARELPRILELIALFDVPSDDEAKEHIVKLLVAKPSDVAATLQQLFHGIAPPRRQPRRKGQPAMTPAPAGGARFIPLDSTGHLIVFCRDEEWQRAEPLIRELDEKAGIGEAIFRTFSLQNAEAADVVTSLQQMFPAPPSGGRQMPVIQGITADSYNNTIKVFASAAFIEKITPIIENLDIRTKGTMTIIHLRYTNAEEIAPILQESFPGGGISMPVARPPQRKSAKAQRRMTSMFGGTTVSIVAEPFTNALLVKAPPKELEQIQSLVDDMEKAAEPARVILTARNRPAAEIAEALQSLMGRSPVRRAPGKKGAPARMSSAGAGALKIVPDGNRIILDGRQDEVAKAVQWIDQIDVIDQQPVTKKYLVQDAEEDEKKLRAMLGLGGARAAAPKAQRGRRQPAAPVPASSDTIQIYADPYEDTLLIRAMPEDFVLIEDLLVLILGEAESAPGTDLVRDPLGDLLVFQLRYKTAWDIGYTLEDLVNAEGRTDIQFDEGPDERTLFVRGCKPGQKPMIEEYIKMFDVPSARGGMGDMLVFDTADKIPPEVLIQLIRSYRSSTGAHTNVVVTTSDTSRVQVVDIHAGESEGEVEGEVVVPPGSALPCVLPASLLGGLHHLTIGQTVEANRPRGPVDPSVCPVCSQSPCTLSAQMIKSLDAVLMASFDDDPPPTTTAEGSGDPPESSVEEPAVPPIPTHNHPVQTPIAEEPAAASSSPAGQPLEIPVFVDPFGRVIITTLPEEERDGLERFIIDMIGGKSPIVYRVFPLKNAEVNTAARLLSSVFNQPQTRQRRARQPRQQPGQQGGKQALPGQKGAKQPQPPAPPPTPARIKVVPDPRTRSLFVAAALSDVPLIIDILRRIDRKVPLDEQSIKVYQLKSLDATQVVQTLREVLSLNATGRRAPRQPRGRGQRGQTPQQQQQQQMLQLQGRQGQGTLVTSEQVSLSADSQTNSIIAKAPPDTLALIQSLIETLEGQDNTAKIEMKRVQLVNARATEVATIAREVAGQLVRTVGGGGRGGRGGSSRSGGVSVNADARTNSVIIAGQAKDLERVEGIIKELDVDDEGRSGIIQIAVKGDAKATADTLKALFGGRGKQTDVVITANAATGVVLVKAPPPLMAKIEAQVIAMEEKVVAEKALRPLQLQFADPEKIAERLMSLFGESGRRRRAGRQINIKGSKSNKMLYIQCPDDMFEEIKEVALGMDKAPPGLQVQSFPLQHASAVGALKQFETLMAQAMKTRGLGDVQLDLIGIFADARTNSLVVSGGDLTFMLVEQVLEKIDVEPETPVKRITKTHSLPRTVSARDVARNIADLFKGDSARTTGVEPPTVTANAAGNTLTIKANEDQHQEILANIIEPIRKAVGDPLEDYQVKLDFRRVDEVKPVLEEFMNKWRQTRGNKPQDGFTITADPNSNMLLLNCSPTTKLVFDKQLAQLDTEIAELAGARQFHTYPLKYASIHAVREAVNQAFRRGDRVAERDQVAVTMDGNTNSVLVLANKDNHERIAEMIATMDVESDAGTKQEYVYRVQVARAVDLSNTLNNIIRSTKTATKGKYPVWTFADEATNTLIVNGSQTEYDALLKTIEVLDTEGGAGRITQTFTFKYAEPWHMPRVIQEQFRTRSRNPNDQVTSSFMNGTMTIVVTASPENMEKVEELIVAADVPSAAQKLTKFIKLQNARADALASMLNQAVRASEPRQRSGIYSVTYGSEMNSNTLIVSAAEEDFETIEATIAELDVVDTGGRLTRTFTFKFAEPWHMPRVIQEQFRTRSRNPNDQVTSSFMNGTMTIVVTASPENMEKVEDLITAADVPSAAQKLTKFIKLENARADALANMLNQAVRAAKPRPRSGIYSVTYGSEMNSNTLIVSASEEDFETIEATIAELDVADTSGRIMRTFTLKYAEPWNLPRAIHEQFRNRTSRNPNDQVSASFINGTMTLVVSANPENMEKVAQFIMEVDVPSMDIKETRFIALKHARADELASALTTAWQAKTMPDRQRRWPVTISADTASNNLIVTAKTDKFDEILRMVAELDVEQVGRIRQVFRLTYADPGSVSSMIQSSFRQPGRAGSPREQVNSSGDGTTNSVIVTASDDNMTKIAALIEELDQPGDAMRNHHIIEVENSNANDVANSLQQIFDAANRGRRGQRASATIRAIAGTTKIAVYANVEELEQIESLVLQIDIEGGRDVHTVTMPELVPAKTVADNVNKLYGGGRGRDGIRAEYHEPTNTLLVYATDSEFEKVNKQVIEVLSQQPTIGALQIFKFPLTYAIADEVASTLQEFFDKKSGAKSQRGLPPWMRSVSLAEKMENQVAIIAEPASNMLIVWCSETTKEMIEDLLKDIDTDEPRGGNKIMEMVTLQYMDATEMLGILTEYLKVSTRTREDPDAGLPFWMRGRGRNQKEDKTVLAGDMRLKSVESMNAIIVVGRPESVQDVLAKIAELDVEDIQGADAPQTIKLINAHASELADTMKRIFNDPARTKARGASYVPPTIVAEEATNSLIVRAKPSDFNLIKKMAEGLDAEMKDESGIHMLAVPVGRKADDLAVLIEDQINESEQKKKQRNRDYRPNLVEIGADAISNTLLVAGSKAQFETVRRLVDDLVARGPAGGTSRRVIKLRNLSPEKAKQLIEQLQQGTQGSSPRGRSNRGGSGRRGRGGRSDAGWTHHRRYEKAENKGTILTPACAATLPGFCAQLALTTAVAQTSPQDQPTEPQRPRVSKIRRRQPTTRPSPARPRMTPEERIRATTQAAAAPFRSKGAQDALRKRLTGAPIEIIEGPPGTIILDANAEDMEIMIALLEMLDTAIPEKQIEYVQLVNSQAKDLAKTLQDVFSKIEPGDRRPGPQDKVDVIADPRTNGIFIAAVEEKMARVLALIKQIEETDIPGKEVRTVPLQNRRVSEAGDKLKSMINTFLKRTGRDPSQIGIEIDPHTNSIFVTGGENDIKFVEQIIKGLDAELPEPEDDETGKKRRPMGEADIMVVPLRVADADKLGTLLNELLQKAATGDTPMKDFIRRMRLLDENGNPIAEINLNRPIAIFGDPESNSVIIASSLDNCLVMKQVVLAFDKEPARAEVVHQVLTLHYADATEVADQLDKILTDSEALTQRPGKSDKFGLPDGASGALVYKAVVKPDPRTNQLIIAGRPESVALLVGLVERLDVKGMEPMPIVFVKLEKASATALEQFLTDMMEKRAEALPRGTGPNADKYEKVIIKADPRSESLIIAARPARMEELRGLIAKLDISASTLIENIRTITLRKGNATEMTEKLKDLWEQRKSQREGGSEGLKLETPAIVADARSNSLIVAASKGDFDVIKAVVDKIEALELNPMADIYIVRLQHNSAKQLAQPFTVLFQKRAEMRTPDGNVRPEDEVSIEVDEVTNTLLIAASRENYEVLMQKIALLDQEIGVPGQVEFFVCDNVGAHRVKDTIEALFQNGVFKPGGLGDSQIAQNREKVTVAVDDRANILIISASPENMGLIREIYKRMNSVVTPWDAAITRLITIEHGDAVKIGAQVQEYFDELGKIRESGTSGGSSSGGGFEITVFADERSNRIIIGGTKDGIDSAVEMVRKLDVPPGVPGQIMEVYTLLEAPASTVGDMIDRIFQERNKPRQGATGPQVPNITVTVESNDATNSLLVNASREDHILIADLVGRLDRPSTIIDMVQLFPLEKARADHVREILEELYQSAGGGEGRSGRTIAVVEDKRTNAVVVAAPPGELQNIAELVRRLDGAEVKGQAEIGVYTCENEDAEKMAELLNEIMTGEGAQGGSGGGESEAREIESMLVSFASRDESGRETLLKTIRENVQITYNVRTNSVIIVAPPTSLKLIEVLIRKLDRIQKRPVLVKVFQLVNSDAERMVQLLEDMFAYEEGSEQEREFQQGREMNVEGGLSSTGGVPAAMSQGGPTRGGTFGRPKTTFVADERTNSIVAAGWPEDVDVVADIIDQLDTLDIQDRDYIVYTLINSEAEAVQSALEAYFQAEQQRLDRVGESLSPQRRMDQEVSLVAHEESNQLIISVSQRYKTPVLSIVEQLDMPPAQVMIQVMIAEVTLDDQFDMGLEFALQELRFSETAVPGGNGVLQSSHFDVIGGTDLGAAGSGLAGFSFTITGEDFNFLVRALQSDSRLEVIQRPMIMCQDNEEANITVGQRVPIVQGTATTTAGQITSTVTYEEVGVILTVEPHINPDGFVYLRVAPEISGIADSTVQVSPGVFAPILNNRSAETTVAVKDGETVVIGGLITTQESEGESKVPFLGDIPGLGALFRTTTRSKNKTELLIALTPRIVRTVEDGRRMSLAARDESGLITPNMKQSPLFAGLRVSPEGEDEIPSVEAMPEPLTPIEPSPPIQIEPKKKYGPAAPRYGPLVPAGAQTVAQRAPQPTYFGTGASR